MMTKVKPPSRWAYSVWWPRAEVVISGIVVGGLVGFVVWFIQLTIVGAVIHHHGVASMLSGVPAVLIGGFAGWVASAQKMGWHRRVMEARAVCRYRQYGIAVSVIWSAGVFCVVHYALGMIAVMAAWAVSWDRFESESMYEVYFGFVWLGVLTVSGLLGLREFLRRRAIVVNEADGLIRSMDEY